MLEFITLDGVIQSPGSPEEDPESGFRYGGWVTPYNDESAGKAMEKLLKPADILLGRKTFDIWENYWPQHAEHWPGINEVTKFVLSTTRNSSAWNNSVFLNNLQDIKDLKNSDGRELKIWGSSELVKLLLGNDLVDELWLMIHPITLGKGKKLFEDSAMPSAFTLAESTVTDKGVIIANYKKAGEIKTGTVGA
jgi:dihydrofolate reductase